MGRRKQVNSEVTEEIKVEDVNTEVTQVEDNGTNEQSEVESSEKESLETTEQSDTKVEESKVDEKPEEVDEDDQSESALDDNVDNVERMICQVVILEHLFDKKIIEKGVYDVYQKGSMLSFRNKNGAELSTFHADLDFAMKLFVPRMFPLDSRARGSKFTWKKL